jgi:transcriptional regulator with XRE-family HTH domain
MEFGEKLQELRKQKGLTQEEVAQTLYVSRTAVSKWESGRGYPNTDSLKKIAKLFSISIDELLSGEELLTLAEEDNRQKENHFRDLAFGLLDLGVIMLLFLPFFAQRAEGAIRSVPLLSLAQIAPYMKLAYCVAVIAIIISGSLTLALQNCRHPLWIRSKSKISLALNAIGVVLFVLGLQPYAATFLLIFLAIKVLLLIKWQ